MKTKVIFYMKSGNVFSVKFKEFEITKLSSSNGQRQMSYKEASNKFTVDIDEIEAVIIKKVLF